MTLESRGTPLARSLGLLAAPNAAQARASIPEALSSLSPSLQWFGEAQLVPVWISHVEISLPPLGIPGSSIGLQSITNGSLVKSINVGDVENYPSPPSPRAPALGDYVQVSTPNGKTSERGPFSAIQHSEPQCAVESDRPCHVICGQSDGANGFNGGRGISGIVCSLLIGSHQSVR